MYLFLLSPCRKHFRHNPHGAVLVLRAFRGGLCPESTQGSPQPLPTQWVYLIFLVKTIKNLLENKQSKLKF